MRTMEISSLLRDQNELKANTMKSGISIWCGGRPGTGTIRPGRAWLLPDRWWHRRRLPDLRGADDVPGPEWHDVPFWSYFLPDQRFNHRGRFYSGAVPNEKITWGKLDIHTPKFVLESDATIVAPLILRARGF